MNSAVVFQEGLQSKPERWRWGMQWPAIGSWQWPVERIVKADSLTTTWEFAKELNIDHSMVVQHLKKIRKVKRLDEWEPHVLTTNQKISSFWSGIFSYSTQQQWTISPLDSDVRWKVDCIQQPAMTSSVVGQKRSSKTLPKDKLAPRKGHGHYLVACCLSDPLQLSESWQNHYIWEVGYIANSVHDASCLAIHTVCTVRWTQGR